MSLMGGRSPAVDFNSRHLDAQSFCRKCKSRGHATRFGQKKNISKKRVFCFKNKKQVFFESFNLQVTNHGTGIFLCAIVYAENLCNGDIKVEYLTVGCYTKNTCYTFERKKSNSEEARVFFGKFL